MKCDQAEELMLDYLEHTLPAEQLSPLESHLQKCAACRDYCQDIRITLSALSAAGSASRLGRLSEADTLDASALLTGSAQLLSDALHGRGTLGEFQIVREIGRGGMGVVYEAIQQSLGRRVALKVLSRGLSPDETILTRFTREARTVGALEHANIVPVYAVGEVHGVHYFAMQFIDGEPLSATIRNLRNSGEPRGRDHYDRVAHWALQAAEALHHAHTRGVIHRDVKPSNLLLDRNDKVWVSDFGLSKADAQVTLTESGNLLGTPRYMSPEQCQGVEQPQPLRSDIYSLGATLYELITLRPVFDGDPRSIVTRHLAGAQAKPIRQFDANVPRDLAIIVHKCLERRPEDRYASAEALAEDLRRFLAGDPILARPLGWLHRTWRWIRRHPTAAALIGILVLNTSFVLTVVGVVTYNHFTGGGEQWVIWSGPAGRPRKPTVQPADAPLVLSPDGVAATTSQPADPAGTDIGSAMASPQAGPSAEK